MNSSGYCEESRSPSYETRPLRAGVLPAIPRAADCKTLAARVPPERFQAAGIPPAHWWPTRQSPPKKAAGHSQSLLESIKNQVSVHAKQAFGGESCSDYTLVFTERKIGDLTDPAHRSAYTSLSAPGSNAHARNCRSRALAKPLQTLTTRPLRLALNLLTSGAFVYRLGHGPLKAERRVRFPYALPLELRVCS
jgi:hypothetical protein